MKLNRILFIVLMIMAVSLAGCGGHNHGNPAGNDNDGGLVNVNGRVSNVSASARVSFYTPEAAMKNGLTVVNSSARASMSSSNDVYAVDTDKDGNYNINIPEATYYVVAEEGDKMTAPAKMSVSSRAAMTTVEDIVLTATTDVNGSVVDSASKPVANVPVFIENTPFMCVSNSTGNFTFNKIPQLSTSATYKIVAYTCIGGVRYSGSHSLTSTEQSSKTNVQLQLAKDSSAASKKISGYVYTTGTTTPVADCNVMAVLPSGQAYSTTTDSNGKYAFELATNDDTVELSADMITFTSTALPSTSDVILYAKEKSSVGTLIVSEPCTQAYDSIFQNCVNTFVLMRRTENGYVECYTDPLNIPVASYAIDNLATGAYCYAFFGETVINTPGFGCKFTDGFEIKAGEKTDVTAQNSVSFIKPTIRITNNEYYAVNTAPSTTSDTTDADGCYSVTVKVSDSDGNVVEGVTFDSATGKINLTSLTQPGEYKLWIEVEFNVNGFTKTYKSDEYPYVVHKQVQSQPINFGS